MRVRVVVVGGLEPIGNVLLVIYHFVYQLSEIVLLISFPNDSFLLFYHLLYAQLIVL